MMRGGQWWSGRDLPAALKRPRAKADRQRAVEILPEVAELVECEEVEYRGRAWRRRARKHGVPSVQNAPTSLR